jgi:hypothetical protein
MEATYTSKTTSPTTTELKSILDRRESLKPKEDEMGMACSMGDKSNEGHLWIKQKERDH